MLSEDNAPAPAAVEEEFEAFLDAEMETWEAEIRSHLDAFGDTESATGNRGTFDPKSAHIGEATGTARRTMLPGGGAEPGERLQAAAVREAWEETGLAVRLTAYLADFVDQHAHRRYYVAERISGTPTDTDVDGGTPVKVRAVSVDEATRLCGSPFDRAALAMVGPQALSEADDNCGTGAGGFQPGNSCAKGAGGTADSATTQSAAGTPHVSRERMARLETEVRAEFDAAPNKLAYRQQAKVAVAQKLGEVVGSKGFPRAAIEQAVDRLKVGHQRIAEGLSDEQLAGVVAGQIVNSWAATSGDSNRISVGLQLAVQREFGVADASVEHLHPDRQKWPSDFDDKARAAPNEIADDPVIRGTLRAMYDHTQGWLRDHGISEMPLIRGTMTDSAHLRRHAKIALSTGTASPQHHPRSRVVLEWMRWW